MDIDSTEAAAVAPGADEQSQQLVEELGTLLESIEATPNDVRLLRRQVDVMVRLGMMEEAGDAVETLSSFSFLGEGLWTRFLDAKIGSIASSPISLDTFADMLELFGNAEKEYLSAAILKRHIQFIISLSAFPAPAEEGYPTLEGDDEVKEYVDADTVRNMVSAIVSSAFGLLNQSQELWQLWMDWELRVFDASTGSARKEQMDRIHEMCLERLQAPQADQDATSSAYSSWMSANCPEEYEGRMVAVTKASQVAKHKWSDKRQGKARADFEEQLAYAPDAGTQLTTLAAYLDWEVNVPTNPKWKNPPKVDPVLARAVFERTVLAYGKVAAAAEDASFPPAASELQTQMVEMANTYKTAEALIWVRYVDFINGAPKEDDESDEMDTLTQRASKACPFSGDLWTWRLNSLEENNEIPAIDASVEKATSLIVANKQPVSALVDVLYAHASILHRRYRSLEPSLEHPVFLNVTAALETVNQHYESGDASFRLEKFFIGWAEAVAPSLLPGVVAVLETPVKSRQASYQMAILLANAQARQGDIDSARQVYEKAIQRWDLDWPEMVYESFILFENIYGTLDSVVAARQKIDKELAKVNRRRQREAERQQAPEQYRAAAEAQAVTEVPATAPETVTSEVVPVPATTAEVVAAPPTDVSAASTVPPAVAAASSSETAMAPAAAEPGADDHLKRDRENTTVLVTGLAKGTTVERLTSFFENWGRVRECTILPGDGGTDAAMVEFRFADAMPAVLERENRKLDGNDIHISMLWRSTLFVTNFPREATDADLRELFGQYGAILQTRWPSRKYKDARRFCYITMESPAAAQEALFLHNFKMNGSQFPMSVLISDPAHKKQRTDQAECTLFVGGLSSNTSEPVVRQLFAKYGNIIGIKLGWDPIKRNCKGFAFVEMSSQNEAKAAIEGLHGTQHNGRHLKVQYPDKDHKSKKKADDSSKGSGSGTAATGSSATGGSTAGTETATGTGSGTAPQAETWARTEARARRVRLYDLPPGTQEGLLQQELEKIVPVKRVEVFQSRHEAQVELASQSDVGLLQMKPFVFNGATIRIEDGTAPRTAPAASGKPAAPTSALAFQPRARKTAKALPKAYAPPKKQADTRASAAAPVPAGSGQDAFRAFMAATNEKRKDKLEEKVASATTKNEGKEDAAATSDPALTASTASTAGQKHALEDADDKSESKRVKFAEDKEA